MKRTVSTPTYALVQFAHWMTFVILGYASPYLQAAGFDNARIGLVIALAGVFSTLLQPLLAGFADRPGKLSPRNLLLAMSAAALLCALTLTLFQVPALLAALLYGLVMALIQAATPFVNALGVTDNQEGQKVNFGLARGMGSLGYAIGAYAMGALIARTDTGVVPILMGASFLLFAAAVWLYPASGKASQPDDHVPVRSTSPLAFVQKYPRFCLVLGGAVLVYVSHSLLNNFLYQIVVHKGGGSAEQGVVMLIAALIELPTMFLFAAMRKKAACGTWLKVSGVFFLLKTAGTLLCPNIFSLYAVQLLQLLAWALIAVCSVQYVSEIMDPQDAVKGQAWFTTTYTVATVLGSTVGGALMDALGVPAMLIFATACAGAGAVIFLLFAGKKRI